MYFRSRVRSHSFILAAIVLSCPPRCFYSAQCLHHLCCIVYILPVLFLSCSIVSYYNCVACCCTAFSLSFHLHFVRCLRGGSFVETITLEVESSDIIDNVKATVLTKTQDKEGAPSTSSVSFLPASNLRPVILFLTTISRRSLP
ncbi:hypothetical protein K435DRAFT_919707, partial [Dendrothele bispora CBS 962.96]